MHKIRFNVHALALVAGALPLMAQGRQITNAAYAKAEKYLAAGPYNALLIGGAVAPNWLADDRFWYRGTTLAGATFYLVDPTRKSRVPLFDHTKVAAVLSASMKQKYTAATLPFQNLTLSADEKYISFTVANPLPAGTNPTSPTSGQVRQFSCDLSGNNCTEAVDIVVNNNAGGNGRGNGGRGGGRGGRGGGAQTVTSSQGEPGVVSPDGKQAAFIRNWNLWLRDVATGQEKQLTTDGTPYFGYATDNAGWSSSNNAILLWSPDSKKIATQQQDERHVKEMYYVSTTFGHPTLRTNKFPLPGDTVMAMLHRVIIDVPTSKVIRLKMDPDFHRGTLSDNINVRDYKWSPDSKRLALASVSRFHNHVWVRMANAETGDVKTIFEEVVKTQFESRTGWQVLWESNEVIWHSERDGWGHLYLYDLNTGQLKNQITRGDGPVMTIAQVDPASRTIWFAANGRETGQDPYFSHAYRIRMDGTGYTSLTPGDGNHTVVYSPSRKWIIDTYSKQDVPPAVELRDAEGKLVMPLEKSDLSKLRAAGWKPVKPFHTTAADGKTQVYGIMFTPTNLDTTRKYPVVNYIYPGPQSGSVGSRSFSVVRGDHQALAELGFVVILIDGRGNPGRSKAFQDSYYGAMGRDNTIPDQIAGIRELAKRYRYIDTTRVGVWGHSGGGFATTSAMFRFPDFYKVGIAESGNHDQRTNEDDWGERYQGELIYNADGTSNYSAEANQEFAKNLKGHLLLAHGTMDPNVPPNTTLMVVDALIKANKQFDLLMIPNAGHGYGNASNYMMKRRWDYFVTWLQGNKPPMDYVIGRN